MNICFFFVQLVESGMLHLYTTHNIDWMKIWIEWCIVYFGRLSWEWLATMVKKYHTMQSPSLFKRNLISIWLKRSTGKHINQTLLLVSFHYIDVSSMFFNSRYLLSLCMYNNLQCILTCQSCWIWNTTRLCGAMVINFI